MYRLSKSMNWKPLLIYNILKGGGSMNVCDFGSVLKSLRNSHNLTQKELGLRIGLSKAVVSKYENGMGYPTFDMLIQIADYFDVTTDYLLGVAKDKTINVSSLNETQIETLQRVIAEFNRDNKKTTLSGG